MATTLTLKEEEEEEDEEEEEEEKNEEKSRRISGRCECSTCLPNIKQIYPRLMRSVAD